MYDCYGKLDEQPLTHQRNFEPQKSKIFRPVGFRHGKTRQKAPFAHLHTPSIQYPHLANTTPSSPHPTPL